MSVLTKQDRDKCLCEDCRRQCPEREAILTQVKEQAQKWMHRGGKHAVRIGKATSVGAFPQGNESLGWRRQGPRVRQGKQRQEVARAGEAQIPQGEVTSGKL